HFLFHISQKYHEYFGRKMAVNQQAAKEGAFVLIVAAGGRMPTMFGGNTNAFAAPFHLGSETDASYLKLMLRRWRAFIDKFPEHRQGLVEIVLSAFTRDALEAALDDILKDANLRKEHVALTEQGLRRPTWMTEAELILELLEKSAANEEERQEIIRNYR